MNALLTPQPPPTPATGDVWASLIEDVEGVVDPRLVADMRDRRAEGIAKYGTPLQTGNGRDFRADAYQEALDGAVYAWGKAIQSRSDEWAEIAYGFVGLAGRILGARP